MILSTHKAELVPVKLEPHGNADNLSIIRIRGYVYVARTETWKNVEYGVYFCPDTLLDTTRSEFHELASEAKYDLDSNTGGFYHRVKAKKLRGVNSFGYMIPASQEVVEKVTNDPKFDLFNYFGCGHYEPKVGETNQKGGFISGGEATSAPPILAPKYDVDSFQWYGQQLFVEGEPVICLEKVHGCLHKDTLILMADGQTEKSIHDVNVHDKVMTYNLRSEVYEPKEVLNKYIQSPTNKLRWIKLTFSNNKELVVTEDHRVLTDDGWLEAKDLTESHNIISY